MMVSRLNKQLYANTSPEKYATFYFALYDEKTQTLTYTNAGHLQPILLRNGGRSCSKSPEPLLAHFHSPAMTRRPSNSPAATSWWPTPTA